MAFTIRRRRYATVRAALVMAAVAATAAGAPPPARPFPVPVAVGRATQVITVRARGSYATVTAWSADGSGWHRVLTTTHARVGAHGVTDGATRRQGSRTTPTGTYPVTRAFGVGPDPGTALPYHHVTPHDWWVEDPDSRWYNRMRDERYGGFPLTEAGEHGSEHLAAHPVPYHHALVVDYNTAPVVPGRGAGIFLHDLGPQAGPTAGCVAVPAGVLTRVLRWIDPARHPVIAIG
ncbi:L,D-transpeptidase family protein [Streptantibioticus cattleyicolor]|uniref:Putative secreted protein n=1 Tax=Streptantibioticus cattleyicolor (strain ATCC 35852 / DSM 46488 / JCM 4925 / NBRC 14057 / NRRL 8057) TaxID=1003195 RepID=F8JJH0_STREN